MTLQVRCPSFQKNVILAILFSALLSFSGVVFAEDIKDETEMLRRETRGEKQVARVAEKAEEKATLARFKTGVTYEDILKDPDNIGLNYRYAQEQISRGELLGAAATLERILLVNPNLADVRLLYAVVLYRLDSLGEAQKELNALKEVPLPPKIKEEVALYQKKIKYQKRRTHLAVRETLGWGFDTNRNAAPSSKFMLFNDVPLGVQGDNARHQDTHFLNVTSVDLTHDLGFQAGHSVFGNFTYYLQDQTKLDSLDLGSFQYELGGTYKHRYFRFTPSFIASHIFLSRENFLRTQGGNFLLEHDFGKKVTSFYDFRVERQDYMNITENNTAYERKGPQFDHTWGFSYMFIPSMRWTSSVGYTDKDAKLKYNSYNRVSLNNSHTWLLWKGQFIINTMNVYFDRYVAPDFAIATRKRHDDILRYRVTYGAPLETLLIGKILPKPFKDIVFTASYEYYRSLSNVTNYTYKDHKFQLLWTKRMEF